MTIYDSHNTVFQELADGYRLAAEAGSLQDMLTLRKDLERGLAVLGDSLWALTPEGMLHQRIKELEDERDEALSRLREYAKESALVEQP